MLLQYKNALSIKINSTNIKATRNKMSESQNNVLNDTYRLWSWVCDTVIL
jgi:hypothetical protein